MEHTVKVRLRKPTRVFTFLCGDVPLKRQDACIVRSDRGLEYGTCIVPPEQCSEEEKNLHKMNVVRKATPTDEASFLQLQQDEKKAMEVCRERIQRRNLSMKLVDAEYTFDKHKVIFYFTAAERVDFRELVRDLAQALRTRIELRHIQVRDEAKIVGGLGVCGRELCCSTWLGDFKPISMKMAKRHNLSLNPTKISGQCGRLLCCLSYENELYQRKKKAAQAEQAVAAAGAVEEEADDEVEVEVDDTAADAAVWEADVSGVDEEIIVLGDDESDEAEEPETVADVPAPATGDTPAPGGPDQKPAKNDRRRRRRRRGAKRSN